MNKYLITGATGNLGGSILKHLLAKGTPVIFNRSVQQLSEDMFSNLS